MKAMLADSETNSSLEGEKLCIYIYVYIKILMNNTMMSWISVSYPYSFLCNWKTIVTVIGRSRNASLTQMIALWHWENLIVKVRILDFGSWVEILTVERDLSLILIVVQCCPMTKWVLPTVQPAEVC